MKKRMVTTQDGDQVAVHFPHWSGDYDTLCGSDVTDPSLESIILPTAPGARVTCGACIAIYDVCRQYRPSDIDRG